MLETKPWYRSRGVVFGVLAILTAVAQVFGYDPANIPDWAESIVTAVLAFGGVWGRVGATKRINRG